MIRVLQCVNIMDRAGLENMLMNYYRNIDKNDIQFDFLTHRPNKGAYEDEIQNLGGKIYRAPRLYPQNYIAYFRWMSEFFREHPEYNIVHSHIDSMSFFPLLAAKKAGVDNRIAHSHSSKLDKDFKWPIKYMALKLLPTVSTCNCACGEVAGKFMFHNKKFRIIRNAIDLEKFSFDEDLRRKKRKELGLTGKFVIGHVGRYCYIKNQMFLLDIFKQIKQENKNAHLLLIGKGDDEKKIKNKIHILNLDNSVSLLIDREDVNQLYQVMDIFVMPSLFEGLPVVGIEAQANGLQCIVSDKISKEIILTDSIKVVNLKDGVNNWKEVILKTTPNRNPNAFLQLKEKGYSVKTEVKSLADFYKSLI